MNQIFRPVPPEARQRDASEVRRAVVSCTEYDDGNPATVAPQFPAGPRRKMHAGPASPSRIAGIGSGPVEYDDGNPATIADC